MLIDEGMGGRILDKICLFFSVLCLEKIIRFKDDFISLYNINGVRDLTPSRHSAMYIYFNRIFKRGKFLSGFTEFGNIQKSGNPVITRLSVVSFPTTF